MARLRESTDAPAVPLATPVRPAGGPLTGPGSDLPFRNGGGLDNESPTLVSIQVMPPVVSKPIGLTQQYSAIGTYTSGPNRDLTAAVAWRSSDTSKASIGASGLATTLGVGAADGNVLVSGGYGNAGTLASSELY